MALMSSSPSLIQGILLSIIAALLVSGCQAKSTQTAPEATAFAENESVDSPTLRENGTDPVISDLVLEPQHSTIRATWQVQNPLSRGFIRVHYYSADGESKWCFSSPTATSTDQCNAGLPALDPCTPYTVTVYAESSLGAGPSGEPASEQDCTLCSGAPTKLTCNQEDTNIVVSWTEPALDCSGTNVSSYTIEWTGVEFCSEQQLNGNSTTVDATAFTLEDTIPYTNYSLLVRAELEDETEAVPAQCHVVTQQTGAPGELTCNQEDTDIIVSWTEPNTVCSVNSYTIEWTGDMLCSEQQLSNSSTVDATSFTLEDTIPYTNYSLLVRAELEDGSEAVPAQCHVVTKQTGTPDQLTCSQEDTQIILTWSQPTSGCSVSNYDIEWTGAVLWSEGQVNSGNSSTVDATAFTLEDTIPYTNYSLLVRAELEDGTEAVPAQCHVVTEQAAPSAPQDLALFASGSSTVSVQWEAPSDLNGVITGYSVQWTEVNAGVDNTITASLQSSSLTYEIEGLQAVMSYQVTVRASTAAGLGAEVRDECETLAPQPAGSDSTAIIVVAVVAGVVVVAALTFAIVTWKRAKALEASNAEAKSDALPKTKATDRPTAKVDGSPPTQNKADEDSDLYI